MRPLAKLLLSGAERIFDRLRVHYFAEMHYIRLVIYYSESLI